MTTRSRGGSQPSCERAPSQPSRAPLRFDRRDPVHPETLRLAVEIADRSGLAPVLDQALARGTGRPPRYGSRAALIAFLANGLRHNNLGHVANVARAITSLDRRQQELIGFPKWTPHSGYHFLCRWLARVAEVLETSPAVDVGEVQGCLDLTLFFNRLIWASLPHGFSPAAVAVDATAIETWATGRPDTDSEKPYPSDVPEHLRARRQFSRLRVLATGDDGSPVYTADVDARGGYRTGTSKRASSGYIGYQLELAVAAKALRWTDFETEVRFGEEVPNVVLGATFSPASTHPAETALPLLKAIKDRYPGIREVLLDPGYSLKERRFLVPLRRLGVKPVFEVVTRQRGVAPYEGEALLVDGTFLSAHTPSKLIGTGEEGVPLPHPSPTRGLGNDEQRAREAIFNARSKFRYSIHAGPDASGTMRLRCPFCAGRLRSRRIPKTMRTNAPLVVLPAGTERCCGGTLRVPPEQAGLFQEIPFGTTAWSKSYGRRQVAESANAGLKQQFVRAESGYLRLFGTQKCGIMLAFATVGFNVDRFESFRLRTRADAS